MSLRSLTAAFAAFAAILTVTTCSTKASTPTQPVASAPACSVVPSAISFGTVLTGAQRDTTITIRNTGGGTLSGNVGESCPDFSIVGTSGFSLAAGQSASVTVRFAPTIVGTRNCTLQAGSCGVACSAIAEAPPVLACEVTPTSIDFGTVTLGQTVDRTFTLKNLSGVTMSGTVSSPSAVFTIAGTAGYSLAPMQMATFIVRFLSNVAGPFSAVIQTGQPSCPTVTCTAVAQQVCSVSTDHLDFGTVVTGTTTRKSFRITNVGSAPMSGVVGTDGTCDGFSVEGAPVNFALTPGQFIDITVRFSPFIGEGAFGCTVLVTGTGVSCASVTCTGSAQFPCNCAVSPTSFNFGDVIVGGQTARQFTISTGGETAIGGVMSVLGTGYVLSTAGNPNIFSTSLGYTVNAGTTQTFNLVFQPGILGPISAAVAISQSLCTRIGSPCDTLHCTGTGIVTPPPPACSVSTTSLYLGTVHAGQAKDSTFTITNTGGGTLSGSLSWAGASYPFSLIGSASYSLGAGQSKTFTVRFVAPSVSPGHTVTYVGTINLGTPCAGLGLLTVQGVAIP
jgi:hypothetical protein